MRPTPEQKREIEARVLLAALKLSMERGDLAGAALAHRELSQVLKQKSLLDTYDQTGSEGAESSKRYNIDVDIPDEADSGSAQPAEEERSPPREEPVELIPAEEEILLPPEELVEIAAAEQESFLPPDELVEIEAAEQESFHPPQEPAEIAPAKAQAPFQESKHVPEEVPTGNLYELLAANPKSSFEVLHVHFLRMVRKLLAERSNRDTSVWQFRDNLRALCVAHDILRDPVTRTDYDFRLLGLRGEAQSQKVSTPDDIPLSSSGNRPPLRIGELLQCSEVLDRKELEIAVDMHKAMPEVPFGQFLVKQDFLTQPELDSALLGQRLILDGKITVAQFQVAMYGVRMDGIALGDTLVTRGWASQEDVDSRKQEDPWAKKVLLMAATPPPVWAEAKPPAGAGEGETRGQTAIAAKNAVPSWAGQLDWGEESESESLKPASEETTDFTLIDTEDGEGLNVSAEVEPEEPKSNEIADQPAGENKPQGITNDTMDDPSPHLPLASLAVSLQEALSLEIQRLERESANPAKEETSEKPKAAGEEPVDSSEPSLDYGELEPPPFPGELEPSDRSKGDKAAGKSRKEKRTTTEQARSRRSKAQAETEPELSDLDNDVE